ncbi:MAG: transketolase [Actinomycetota bacterium]|nr:transketolase [Actinomycetota bacterium]
MEQRTTVEDRQALVDRLTEEARQLRITDIRMLIKAGSGHPGGTLSAADLIAALFLHKMGLRPQEPEWPDRDRFVLSKGHCVPIVYAALARLGYFPEDWLWTLRKLGSPLQGHPDRVRCPGIEAATGSLGQGLSMAVGMAMAGKLDGASWRVYCMLGDGESQAGQIWEAGMLAGKHGLTNLTAILDQNQVQQSDRVVNILDIDPVVAKWRAFGWHVREINGHDMEEILDALDETESIGGQPTMIVAHTIKGKGVSWMELNPDWHGKAPSEEEGEIAIAELEGTIDADESRKRFEALEGGGH